jgi:hypothetical protein
MQRLFSEESSFIQKINKNYDVLFEDKKFKIISKREKHSYYVTFNFEFSIPHLYLSENSMPTLLLNWLLKTIEFQVNKGVYPACILHSNTHTKDDVFIANHSISLSERVWYYEKTNNLMFELQKYGEYLKSSLEKQEKTVPQFKIEKRSKPKYGFSLFGITSYFDLSIDEETNIIISNPEIPACRVSCNDDIDTYMREVIEKITQSTRINRLLQPSRTFFKEYVSNSLGSDLPIEHAFNFISQHMDPEEIENISAKCIKNHDKTGISITTCHHLFLIKLAHFHCIFIVDGKDFLFFKAINYKEAIFEFQNRILEHLTKKYKI